MRILLDCDEVLADFIGGVCKEFQVEREALEFHWELGRWDAAYDIRVPLSKALKQEFTISPVAFWSQIKYNETFWLGLNVLPWARELLAHVKLLTDEWYIVSAPIDCHTCYSGKLKWLQKKLQVKQDKVILTPHKHLLAKKDVLLIDDSMDRCCHFIDHGGSAILFPALHNECHRWRSDPMVRVKEQLRCI